MTHSYNNDCKAIKGLQTPDRLTLN